MTDDGRDTCGYPCVECPNDAEPMVGAGTQCLYHWFKDNPEVTTVIFDGYKHTFSGGGVWSEVLQ